MSTSPHIPVTFVLPEFESTITLEQHLTTEVEAAPTVVSSFICDVNMSLSLFRDIFLFTSADVENWDSSENLEKTMFIVNRSQFDGTSYWKTYSESTNMFEIHNAIVSTEYLNVSSYTSKINVDVTEILCAWYMSRILNGIKDAQVLVNNALTISNNIKSLFNNGVFNTSIDSILWHYNCWSSSGSYPNAVPSYESFIKHLDIYEELQLVPGYNVYGVPFINGNTNDNQTLPQRIFEQLGYSDMQRIRTLSAGNYIKEADVYNIDTNPNSRISPYLFNNSLQNVYRYPFIADDQFKFKLKIKLKQDNTLNIFNSANNGNITAAINDLNAGFNEATEEHVFYLSFTVRITLVDDSAPLVPL